MRVRALLLWLSVFGLGAGVGRAEEDPSRLRAAADAFDEGARAFKAGRFEEAAERFETADRLAPSPAALANAIRARRSARHGAQASTEAAAALARYPDDPALRDLAQSVLKANEKNLYRLKVSCQPQCSLTLDGKVVGASEVGVQVIYLDPGAHSVSAGWSEGRTRSASVQAQRGGTEAVSLEAPPLPPPVPSASAPPAASTSTSAPVEVAPAPASNGLSPWFFLVGLGATAVVGGLATWSGLNTLSDPGPDRVRDACAGQSRDCPLFQEGLAKERRTNVLLVGTGVLGVATGVVALLTDWKKPPFGGGTRAPESTAVRPWVAPGVGTGVGLTAGVNGVFLEMWYGQVSGGRPVVATGQEGR